ncbi:MAG: ATP synthase F0 subunit B [Candidatus Gracilibacteria bacterium]|nr:ATP synthase F0 subunit B [Candidatus Gracilibacteria bacterium]
MDLKFVTPETFVIQFIILMMVIWVLNKFIFKPYLAYLDEMDVKQKKLEKDYKNIDSLIKDAEEKKEVILKEARKKGDEIISEAETIGKKKRENIIFRAENDAKDLFEGARSEIEKERLFMLNSIRQSVVNLVVKLNSKLFKQENITKDYIEKELETINI